MRPASVYTYLHTVKSEQKDRSSTVTVDCQLILFYIYFILFHFEVKRSEVSEVKWSNCKVLVDKVAMCIRVNLH